MLSNVAFASSFSASMSTVLRYQKWLRGGFGMWHKQRFFWFCLFFVHRITHQTYQLQLKISENYSRHICVVCNFQLKDFCVFKKNVIILQKGLYRMSSLSPSLNETYSSSMVIRDEKYQGLATYRHNNFTGSENYLDCDDVDSGKTHTQNVCPLLKMSILQVKLLPTTISNLEIIDCESKFLNATGAISSTGRGLISRIMWV